MTFTGQKSLSPVQLNLTSGQAAWPSRSLGLLVLGKGHPYDFVVYITEITFVASALACSMAVRLHKAGTSCGPLCQHPSCWQKHIQEDRYQLFPHLLNATPEENPEAVDAISGEQESSDEEGAYTGCTVWVYLYNT